MLHAIRAHQPQILKACRKSGTTVASLDTDRFLAYEIDFPSRDEQCRIMTMLDSFLARSSSARRELDYVPNLIERYKQAILAKAFQGELTGQWREANPSFVTVVGNENSRSNRSLRSRKANAPAPDFKAPYDLPETWRWDASPGSWHA